MSEIRRKGRKRTVIEFTFRNYVFELITFFFSLKYSIFEKEMFTSFHMNDTNRIRCIKTIRCFSTSASFSQQMEIQTKWSKLSSKINSKNINKFFFIPMTVIQTAHWAIQWRFFCSQSFSTMIFHIIGIKWWTLFQSWINMLRFCKGIEPIL